MIPPPGVAGASPEARLDFLGRSHWIRVQEARRCELGERGSFPAPFSMIPTAWSPFAPVDSRGQLARNAAFPGACLHSSCPWTPGALSAVNLRYYEAPMTEAELEVCQTVQAPNRAWTTGHVEELRDFSSGTLPW